MNTPNAGEKFSCPEFLAMERTIIDDFVDCTRDCCAEVEICVKALNAQGGSEYIHRMFRSMHSLKGNCQMVGLGPLNALLHRIEEVFSKIRAHPEQYLPELGEFLLLATDEIEALLSELIRHGQADDMKRKRLSDVCDKLQKDTANGLTSLALTAAIESLGGRALDKSPLQKGVKVELVVPEDTVFMRGMAAHLDKLSIFRKNRSEHTLELVGALNIALGNPADAKQLEAAAWMHDVGMCLIPQSIYNKESALSREEQKILQSHVQFGSQLLMRFGGWEDAAQMVLDHHEFFDGTGYPNGIAGEQIHPGARMLSIVDTFCSITTERSDRGYKKSLMQAVSEINANIHVQFDPEMVTAFNDVVRSLMMKQ
ncbi:HD domain-containing phosphohydrolase [Undibacterium sp. RuRC25W]|uniref:HD domain-containing phosphohydrolase n=1 Tax=Undibacterium sp. RuRC25W TaxID=3413047 RepID=UPI003BF33C94